MNQIEILVKPINCTCIYFPNNLLKNIPNCNIKEEINKNVIKYVDNINFIIKIEEEINKRSFFKDIHFSWLYRKQNRLSLPSSYTHIQNAHNLTNYINYLVNLYIKNYLNIKKFDLIEITQKKYENPIIYYDLIVYSDMHNCINILKNLDKTKKVYLIFIANI